MTDISDYLDLVTQLQSNDVTKPIKFLVYNDKEEMMKIFDAFADLFDISTNSNDPDIDEMFVEVTLIPKKIDISSLY